MKKRLLSNRVRNAILMAILLQSIIFGIGLVITGTFSGTANRSTGTATRLGSDTSRNVTVPYMAMLMRSQGKSDTSISTALRQDGYSSAEIAQILQQMRR